MNNQKVVFFGIDGADYDLICRWRDELPTLNKLIKQGVFGKLRSTIPPATAPAWSSMFSGKSSAKTSVIDFVSDAFSDQQKTIVNSHSIKTNLLWDILTLEGKRSLVLSAPLTYPPYPIEGIMVSGFMTPENAEDITYPPEISKEITYYKPSMEFNQAEDQSLFFEKAVETAKGRLELLTHMLDREDWEFCAFVLQETDFIQHFFYKHPENQNATVGLSKIKQFFKFVDKALEQLLLKLPDEHVVIVASDHGFGRTPVKYCHLNVLLEREGFIKRSWTGKMKGLARAWILNNKMKAIINKFTRAELPGIRRTVAKKMRFNSNEVDKKNIKALFHPSFSNWGFIKIYDEGLNSRKHLDEFRKMLSALRDPETGERVIKACYLRRELFQGPFSDNIPELIVEFNEKYVGRPGFGPLITPIPHFRTRVADHKRDGIFIAKGPPLRKGFLCRNPLEIYDVMPVILYLMGVPFPRDLDGKLRAEIFERGAETINTELDHKDYPKKSLSPLSLDEKQEEQVKERLSDLGYL